MDIFMPYCQFTKEKQDTINDTTKKFERHNFAIVEKIATPLYLQNQQKDLYLQVIYGRYTFLNKKAIKR
jgi:hypothetical protein